MNKRDWQADMTECQMWKTRTTSSLPRIGIHWLHQYAEVKEERDGWRSLAENLNADVRQLQQELAAERERAIEAEAREQKLKEAIKRCIFTDEEEYPADYLESVLSSLYPKETTE